MDYARPSATTARRATMGVTAKPSSRLRALSAYKGAAVRYRRFGKSDLEVSEVGFGVWTLASDWWGRVDDGRGMSHSALDLGINLIDTAPVYGDGGIGETLLAE